GPVQFPISIKSPLNAESAFGLAAMLLIALRSVRGPGAKSRRFDGADALICCGIAVFIVAVFARTAGWYFLSDDFILIKYAAQATHNLKPTFTTAGGDGFYRPLVYASFAWSRLGVNPVEWHAVGIAIHLLNSILVFWLGLELRLSRFAAGMGAALFAVHATRPEVVVWVTGRFDLLATLFVLLTLVCFLRGGWLRVIAFPAMVLGLISKESAYAAPVALLVLMVASGDWKGKRALAYLPFFGAAAAVFAYRWSLFHGIGGYLTAAGTPQALSLHAVTVIKALMLRVWAILFFPINWAIQPGIWLGVATIFYLAAVGALTLARADRRSAAVLAALMGAFLLPVIPVMLIGADLEKARYLYLPSAAFCLLLAMVADGSRWRWPIVCAIFVFQLAALWHNLAPWKAGAEMSRAACETIAREPARRIAVVGVPGYEDGVQVFANGLKECVDLENPRHGALTIVLNDPTPPAGGDYDRVFVWDEASRALKRIN
ncbi:MAG TPA: hypothetical protein VKS01_09175, partial [Bryobacteraceae bacterium]|nr:hypothetical protein [Bryobacteraceae bacterium]